jgi:hypothetical protein
MFWSRNVVHAPSTGSSPPLDSICGTMISNQVHVAPIIASVGGGPLLEVQWMDQGRVSSLFCANDMNIVQLDNYGVKPDRQYRNAPLHRYYPHVMGQQSQWSKRQLINP